MDTTLIAELHSEERMILAELRGSIRYRRLEEIRHLLGLYVQHAQPYRMEEPPIGAFLDQMLGDAGPCRPPQSERHPDVIPLRSERAIA